jgi:hypothetical protein
MNRRGFVLLVVLVATALSTSAWAQSTGSIAGLVTDGTGAVLPGVTVESSSPALIEKTRTVTTDAQGRYLIDALPAGTYRVTFTITGFRSVAREGIQLTTGFTATVNSELAVGSVSETVTVSGATPLVDVQNVRTQNVLSREVLDALPTNKSMHAFASLTVGLKNEALFGKYDVGGNKTDSYGFISAHGSSAEDGHMLYNGMSFNNQVGLGGGRSKQFFVNSMDVEEIQLQMGGMSAEVDSGGVQMNVVPKSGGNLFAGSGNFDFTNGDLQANNLSDALKARQLTTVTQIKKIYDYGAGFGGPFKQNKLWFYTSHRWWGSQEWAADKFYNLNEGGPIYAPDRSRRANTDFYQQENSGRIKWAATNKQTYTFSFQKQHNCNCNLFVDFPDKTIESTVDYTYYGIWLGQATWVYPATNRLLLQAGATHLHNQTHPDFQPEVSKNAIATHDLATGFWYNAPPAGNPTYCPECGPGTKHNYSQQNQRFSLSYVAKSHDLKVGVQTQEGIHSLGTSILNPEGNLPVQYTLFGGAPYQVEQFALPVGNQVGRMMSLGLYAQDQWIVKKLTLNLGLRYDHYKAWVPEQTRPAGYFTGELHVNKVDNAGNFNDLGPRLGVSYDVFGNGKTAIKGSVGRYLGALGAFFADNSNPAVNLVIQTPRTWNDSTFPAGDPRRGNYVPDCDLRNPAANAECGALQNNQFGNVVPSQRLADDALQGWFNRRYIWQTSASVQHELAPNVSVDVGYFRTWFGNFTVTDNTLVTPADYDSFCITLPRDSRLPGGGGNQLCDLGDIKPAKFGLVDRVVTQASHFGKQERIYDGVDAKLTARVKGAILTGGWNTGRTRLNTPVVDAPVQFRDNRPPFQSEFKVGLSYELPYEIRVATVIQNIPGAPKCFDVGLSGCLIYYVATDAQISQTLGRHLSACGAVTVGCTAYQLVTLAEPNTLFEDRATQIDLRFSKRVALGKKARILGKADLYNLLNRSAVARQNFVYGPAYGIPTEVMGGRLFKFGATLEF